MHGLMREGWPTALRSRYLGTATRKGRKQLCGTYGISNQLSTLPFNP
jgi:hypothetical protein